MGEAEVKKLEYLANSKKDAVGAIIEYVIAAKQNHLKEVVFPKGDYLLEENVSIPLFSDTSYIMDGVRFISNQQYFNDPFYVFKGENLKNTNITGGEIIGSSEWSEHNQNCFRTSSQNYMNIGGVLIIGGETEKIQINGLRAKDLTAAGILIISKDDNRARNINIVNCNIVRASPNYADYLTETPAGALASKDWDTRANIFIKNSMEVRVVDCKAMESHCDGITLENCVTATVTGCEISKQHMGGLVLIGGHNIFVNDCHVVGNGSRGITIEEGCKNANVNNCISSMNGREGFWIDRGCSDITLKNINFESNGRKGDLISTATYPGNKTSHIKITKGHSKQKNENIEITGCSFMTADQLYSIEVEKDSLLGLPIKITGNTFAQASVREQSHIQIRPSVAFEKHIQAAEADIELSGNTGL